MTGPTTSSVGEALTRSSASADVLASAARTISPATRIAFPDLVVCGGRGATIWNQEGKQYIDLHAMAAIMNVGYGHPRVVEAIVEQAQRFIHGNPAYVVHELPVRLASRLTAVTPGDFPKRVAFGLSGSDAVDGAIKLARAATGRPGILTFRGAYHGNTYGALSVSSASPAMRRGFDPILSGIFEIDFPKPADTTSEPVSSESALSEFASVLDQLHGQLAAVILEPVQGDSGIHVPPAGYLAGVGEIAREHGVLVVADEVQTGIGRTGKMFASEHFDLVPDILLTGKALGGGLPISAIVARSELMNAWTAPGHVFSTSANPIAAAAALAVLDVVADEGLVQQASTSGDRLRERLRDMQTRQPVIAAIRGLGLMVGLQLGDPGSDRMLAAKVVKRAFDRGCFVTFLAGSVLRFVPPLVITNDELDRSLAIVEDAIAAAVAGEVSDDEVLGLTGW